jgi:hypothetical protein
MVLRRSSTLGEWSIHNTETPKGRICEVNRNIDLGILWDIPWPLDLCQGQSGIDHSRRKGVVRKWITRTPNSRSDKNHRSKDV